MYSEESKSLVVKESTVLLKLVTVFNRLFQESLNTQLIGGAEEPLYQPEDSGIGGTIFFTKDYLASSLHEIAHWCIAGEDRRKTLDYGYWYAPDGRSEEQQGLFELVEVKPQAIEWILSSSCGVKFRLSADNLNGGASPSDIFQERVCAQAKAYCRGGLPKNALELVAAFEQAFSTDSSLNPSIYTEGYFLQ